MVEVAVDTEAGAMEAAAVRRRSGGGGGGGYGRAARKTNSGLKVRINLDVIHIRSYFFAIPREAPFPRRESFCRSLAEAQRVILGLPTDR